MDNDGMLDRASKWATRVSVVAAGLATAGLATHITVEVAVRNLGIGSIVGTTEIVAGVWMILVVFFSIGAAQRAREHTEVTILTSALGPRLSTAASLVALTLTFLVFALIGWFGLENALHNMRIGEYDASSRFPLWPARFAVPICALAVCLDVVASLAKIARRSRAEGVTS